MPVSYIVFNIRYFKYDYILAEQQQQQQQGFEHQQQGQQGTGFVQNVQYQTMPQYGVSG